MRSIITYLNHGEVFTIDNNIIIRDFCLFILGIYGTKIYNYMYILFKERTIKEFLFLAVSFVLVHMLFNFLQKNR